MRSLYVIFMFTIQKSYVRSWPTLRMWLPTWFVVQQLAWSCLAFCLLLDLLCSNCLIVPCVLFAAWSVVQQLPDRALRSVCYFIYCAATAWSCLAFSLLLDLLCSNCLIVPCNLYATWSVVQQLPDHALRSVWYLICCAATAWSCLALICSRATEQRALS